MNIQDQQTDISGRLLYQYAGDIEDAEFASHVRKMAGAKSEMQKIASDQFAFPEQRKFPVNTIENTIMSKVYFDAQSDKFPSKTADDISSRLDTFLNIFEVPEGVFEKKKMVKSAGTGPEPRYLVPSIKLCKVASARDLVSAGDLFDREHDHLRVAQRVEFAQNFINASSDFGHEKCPPAVAKYACMMDTDLTSTSHMLRLRAAAAKRIGKDGGEYVKMAEQIEMVTEAPSNDDLRKLAECIQGYDEKNGLDGKAFRNRIPCPYSVVFNKQAVDEDPGSDIDLETMSKGDIVARLGKESLDALEDDEGNIDREKLKEMLDMQKATKAND